MPIEVKELNIKISTQDPNTKMYVVFSPGGQGSRSASARHSESKQYATPEAFAMGLREAGVPTKFSGPIVILSRDAVDSSFMSKPRVYVSQDVAKTPAAPGPIPIPYPVAASPSDIHGLEGALHKAGYANVLIRREVVSAESGASASGSDMKSPGRTKSGR